MAVRVRRGDVCFKCYASIRKTVENDEDGARRRREEEEERDSTMKDSIAMVDRKGEWAVIESPW